jgi:hypothetical protein
MNKTEVLKLIESIDDEGSVDEVLSQSDFAKSLVSSGLTLDAFKTKINDPDFKSFLDSQKDTHFNTALDTWKSNNLDKIIQSELIKKNPTLTPEQLKLQELETKLNDSENKRQLSEQKSKLKDEMREQNVDPRIIDLLINSDETVTKANIQLYLDANKNYVQKEVENRLKAGQYTPPGSDAEKASQLEKQINSAFGLK